MIITMNTFAVLVCLAAVAAASPQFRAPTRQTFQDERQVAILRDDRQDSGDGNFNYNFETENGISVSGSGAPGSEGQSNMQGSYRFTLPDGTIAEVRYVADEFGFRAENQLKSSVINEDEEVNYITAFKLLGANK
ncbi:cuticle protein AM1159-like [Penaeus monodon]|uniref:cuticle protein AM1159-like n=1 Tax=Penaeus monodon TaxID=6687 RepID=UPI0018A7458F|nr:cuticle protein AM1159-like [Penaeus monodon]